jgi:hypothetical protein
MAEHCDQPLIHKRVHQIDVVRLDQILDVPGIGVAVIRKLPSIDNGVRSVGGFQPLTESDPIDAPWYPALQRREEAGLMDSAREGDSLRRRDPRHRI